MIGDKDLNIPIERASDPEIVNEIWRAAEDLEFSAFISEPGPILIDDHIPFLQQGIPAVLIIDFTYPSWHTKDDTIDKVSAQSLQIVGRTIESWLIAQGEVEPSTTQ
jgi:hypothetical protein